MANKPFNHVAYSLNQPLTTMAPYPKRANRVPTVNDTGYDIGQLWLYPAGSQAFILVELAGNAAIWNELQASGGSSTFTDLTVTVGPTDITGTTGITGDTTVTGSLSVSEKLNITQGTASASVGISGAMVAGTITINTTAVTSNSRIFLTSNSPGGTAGILSAPQASIVPGVSFVINSSEATDTATVNWLIIN